MYLYILCSASPSGFNPTSSKTAYLGFSSLQNPLKNQLWEDNFPLFLYLTQRKRFMKVYNSLYVSSSFSSNYDSSASRYFFSLMFYGNLSMPCLTFILKLARQARSSREFMYSQQYLSPSFSVRMISGRIFLMLVPYSSNNFSSEKYLTSSSVTAYSFLYSSLAQLMKNGLNLLGRSSQSGFSFFNFSIVLSNFLIVSYSCLTLENLLQFLSNSSAGSKRKLLTFLISSQLICSSVIVLALFAIYSMLNYGAMLSPKLILFILSNSQKQSTTVGSTFSMPSISTKTPILSELMFYLVTRLEIFSATPARVLLSIFLSSLYMHTQMASSIPSLSFIKVRMLSCPFFLISANLESMGISTMSCSSYLLFSMLYLTAIFSPAGSEVGFKCVSWRMDSVLQVLRWIQMGFKKPRCVMSQSFILEHAYWISRSAQSAIFNYSKYKSIACTKDGKDKEQTCFFERGFRRFSSVWDEDWGFIDD